MLTVKENAMDTVNPEISVCGIEEKSITSLAVGRALEEKNEQGLLDSIWDYIAPEL